MWMARESDSLKQVAGQTVVVGRVVSKVESPPQRSGGFFAGSQTDVWMFRVQNDETGDVVSVRFEGPINALLDHGDHVHVKGYTMQGVLHARLITDEHGTVLAKAKCFVATVACGTMWAPEVETLRRFRDQVLARSRWGCVAIALYWRIGPRLASWLETRPRTRFLVRALAIRPVCKILYRYAPVVVCRQRRERHF